MEKLNFCKHQKLLPPHSENTHVASDSPKEKPPPRASIFGIRRKTKAPELASADFLSRQAPEVLDIIESYLPAPAIVALARTNKTLNSQLTDTGRLKASRLIPAIENIDASSKESNKLLARVKTNLKAIKHDLHAIEPMLALAKHLLFTRQAYPPSLGANGKKIFAMLIELSRELPAANRDRLLLALNKSLTSIWPASAVQAETASLHKRWQEIVSAEFGASAIFAGPDSPIAGSMSHTPVLSIGPDSQIHVSLPGRESELIVANLRDAKIVCMLPSAPLQFTKNFNQACTSIDPFDARQRSVEVRYPDRVAYRHGSKGSSRQELKRPVIYLPQGETNDRTGPIEIVMPGSSASHNMNTLADALTLIDCLEELRAETERRFKREVEFIGGPSGAVAKGLSVRVVKNGRGLELWLPGEQKHACATNVDGDSRDIANVCRQLKADADAMLNCCASLAKLGETTQIVSSLPQSPGELKSNVPHVAVNPLDPAKFDLLIPGEKPLHGLTLTEVNEAIDPWHGDLIRYKNAVHVRFKGDVHFHDQVPSVFPEQPVIWPGHRKDSFVCAVPGFDLCIFRNGSAAMNFRDAMNAAARGLQVNKETELLDKRVHLKRELPPEREWDGRQPLAALNLKNPFTMDALIPGQLPLSGVKVEQINAAVDAWNTLKEKIRALTGAPIRFLTESPAGRPMGVAIWPDRSTPNAFGFTLPGLACTYVAVGDGAQTSLDGAIAAITKAADYSERVHKRFGDKVVFFADKPEPLPASGAIWMSQEASNRDLWFKLPNSNDVFKVDGGNKRRNMLEPTMTLLEQKMSQSQK